MQRDALASKSPQRPFIPILCAVCADCPLCKQLKEQLRFWREREWMQKTRDDTWAKIRAKQAEIPVNVNSKWAGALVESDPDGGASEELPSAFGGLGATARRSTVGGAQGGLGGLGLGLTVGAGMGRKSLQPALGFRRASLHAARLSVTLPRCALWTPRNDVHAADGASNERLLRGHPQHALFLLQASDWHVFTTR